MNLAWAVVNIYIDLLNYTGNENALDVIETTQKKKQTANLF